MNTQNLVLNLKRLLFRRGEPYRFGKDILRFMPHTRPVRMKYRDSDNDNVRNDALQVELILNSLSYGDVAVDIGAHAGQYAVLMASRVGADGQVVVFEPDPDARVQLSANFDLNPKMKRPEIIVAACSDTTGSAPFFTQGGNSQSSLAISALPANRETKEIQIETIRLDDWWRENGKGVPKLIKIDTEGAEICILRGMPDLLRSEAMVVCELHPYAWREFGVTLDDLKLVVSESGRKMVWLDGSGLLADDVKYGTVLVKK